MNNIIKKTIVLLIGFFVYSSNDSCQEWGTQSDNKKNKAREEKIWVRIYQNGKKIGEGYVTPEEYEDYCRKNFNTDHDRIGSKEFRTLNNDYNGDLYNKPSSRLDDINYLSDEDKSAIKGSIQNLDYLSDDSIHALCKNKDLIKVIIDYSGSELIKAINSSIIQNCSKYSNISEKMELFVDKNKIFTIEEAENLWEIVTSEECDDSIQKIISLKKSNYNEYSKWKKAINNSFKFDRFSSYWKNKDFLSINLKDLDSMTVLDVNLLTKVIDLYRDPSNYKDRFGLNICKDIFGLSKKTNFFRAVKNIGGNDYKFDEKTIDDILYYAINYSSEGDLKDLINIFCDTEQKELATDFLEFLEYIFEEKSDIVRNKIDFIKNKTLRKTLKKCSKSQKDKVFDEYSKGYRLEYIMESQKGLFENDVCDDIFSSSDDIKKTITVLYELNCNLKSESSHKIGAFAKKHINDSYKIREIIKHIDLIEDMWIYGKIINDEIFNTLDAMFEKQDSIANYLSFTRNIIDATYYYSEEDLLGFINWLKLQCSNNNTSFKNIVNNFDKLKNYRLFTNQLFVDEVKNVSHDEEKLKFLFSDPSNYFKQKYPDFGNNNKNDEEDDNTNSNSSTNNGDMTKEDAIKIMGLGPNPSRDDVKKAYNKLALKYHPDKNRNKSEQERKEAIEKFRELQSAYEVLIPKNK